MKPYYKTDISILKYKTYISRHTEKAYGYFCLGALYFRAGKYSRAEDYFNRALKRDQGYIRAVLGLIHLYSFRKKYLKAVGLYNRYYEQIHGKKLYVNKLTSLLSSLYGAGIVENSTPLMAFGPVKRLVAGQGENIVLNLILAIYYLSKNQRGPHALGIYNKCIYLKKIDDNFRWELLGMLKHSGRISSDTAIAPLFQSLPDNCTSEYANVILESAFKSGDENKIKNIFKILDNYNRVISSSNLWKYLYWSRDRNHYDMSVYNCCRRLLRIGWMDRLVAETLFRLKQMNIADPTEKENRLLQLYGYESLLS